MHNFEQSEEYLGIARVYQSNYAKHALYMHNFEQSEEYLGISQVYQSNYAKRVLYMHIPWYCSVINVPCICTLSSSLE